ncbi:MAG: helix-turn-helix domain-containing protein [Phenylobacterium sp.]|nr:helix-turn-helix domain-containing protein [Phenylobacterium sp.]
MRWDELAGDDCPIARTLSVIGDRWSALILRDALRGVTRFDGFQARLGCSREMVSRRLANLVEAGVLERKAYQAHPERFDYLPTDKARALGHVLMMMAQWGEAWLPTSTSRPLERRHRACGHSFTPTLVCSECLAPLEPGGVDYPNAAARA